MSFKNFLGVVFWFPKVPKYDKAKREEIYKKSVQSVSTGNYSIQTGHYITQNQIQKLKKELLDSCVS